MSPNLTLKLIRQRVRISVAGAVVEAVEDSGADKEGEGGGNFHRGDMYCYICENNSHQAHWCETYMHGPKMRERLKQLNRCDACLV